MKKFIAMLLALVMVLSLVACGDKKDDAAGTNDSDKDSQDTITLKMHFVDPETAPFFRAVRRSPSSSARRPTAASRSRFSPVVPSAASATRSSSRWTTAWISPPARTPC